jgi:hypothetical protein
VLEGRTAAAHAVAGDEEEFVEVEEQPAAG